MIMTYKQLVAKTGAGFHPDTPAGDYTSLPEGVTVREFEKIVLNAHNRGQAYKEAWQVFIEQGWVQQPEAKRQQRKKSG